MNTEHHYRGKGGRPISLNSSETAPLERPQAGGDIEITVKSGVIRIAVKQSKNVEDVTLAVEGLLEPEKVENILGRATVQESFKIPKIGFIAGSKVLEGSIVRNGQARVIRDEEQIADGEVTSLKHLKDDVKEIKEGFECGIGIDTFSKFKDR